MRDVDQMKVTKQVWAIGFNEDCWKVNFEIVKILEGEFKRDF